ncbi:MAG: acyl-CoA dehydrogenase family protein [bacterium]|nr:acyl-CoA dehydrogenase family protein [bacterium]
MAIATHPNLTDEQAALRSLARDFAEGRLAPGAADRDRTEAFPEGAFLEAARLGLLGVEFPEALGGGGRGISENILVLEELARVDASFSLTVAASSGLAARHICIGGSKAQAERWIPPLLEGGLGAWALTEPDAGSDAAALKCRAAADGGGYVLNGAKMFISQGSRFSTLVVMARTGEGHGGISAFVVEKGDAGRTSRPLKGKLGMRSMDTAEIVFENCRIPGDRLLGRLGGGFAQAMAVIVPGRIGVSGIAAGIGQGALEAAENYALERRAFGKNISDFGAIREMLAESAIDLAASRALTEEAARRWDAGEECEESASMAKLFASEAAVRVCDRAIQIFGGSGYLDDTPVGRFWRDARLMPIGEGTSEIQRVIISKSVLS